MQHPNLCIAGGGTGGHVMPALALADASRQQWPNLKVHFIGAERGLEADLLKKRHEHFKLLNMHSIMGAGYRQKLRVLLYELPLAVVQIIRFWKQQRPCLVVGVGGYASAAAVFAAVICRIPVVLYEQNAIPGLVNRQMARFSQHIMLGFAEAEQQLGKRHCIYTGNMVRASIRQLAWQPASIPQLLILGGSQGANIFNTLMPEVCQSFHKACFVHHIAGPKADTEHIQAQYDAAGIAAKVWGFCDHIEDLYQHSSLLIARAGAMTVCEAAAIGLPALFIPLPTAADQHQHHNAAAMVQKGAAILLEQAQCDVQTLATQIEKLLFQPKTLQAMHQAGKHALPQDSCTRQLAVLRHYIEDERP